MDFKVQGISWVGNVYQKFEAMCLEVEDVVCQETAKYVESQVQTVGSSVKKFYAEVLQDLLPPSSLDPQKSEVKSLCQEHKDGVDTYKGSKAGIEKHPINVRLRSNGLSAVITPGKNSSAVSLGSRVQNKNHLLPSSSVNPDIAANSRLLLERNDNDETCTESHIPIEIGPFKANPPLPDVLELLTPAEKGMSQPSSLNSHLKKDHAKNAQMKVTSLSSICDSHRESGTSCSHRVVEIGQAADNSSAFQSSSFVLPVVLSEGKGVENALSISNDFSTKSNGVDTLATFNALPLKRSSWNDPGQFNEDDDHADLNGGDDIVELFSETIDDFQNAKLEESCIVVDSEELPFVLQQTGKHRSYKKKIRDALASRMRLVKKQEYDQLGTWQGDTNDPPRTESSCLTKDLKKSPSHDNGESEWELL
ncbi:hypothetical protein AQUCO_08100027v1 [Aquilegia coerulea]|uniref:Uncharacterized protein n=1 Tax=Aquilegia coerulea TaxID=218851 RepID=A0A2G5C7N7_AQUCA|nr:hypothetical protein AQUCO_08100027v1 [Aquilegia coerulea]